MTDNEKIFDKRVSVEQVEEGHTLAPKFDQDGLIPCITTSSQSGEVLMLGYMNKEALTKTIETGEAHYWSRSRKLLWHKGADSGLVQKVVEMRVDDDQDAVWIAVEVATTEQTGNKEASCHVGYRSCFYREVPTGVNSAQPVALIYKEDEKTFDPQEVYGDVPNPTQL